MDEVVASMCNGAVGKREGVVNKAETQGAERVGIEEGGRIRLDLEVLGDDGGEL